MNEIKAEAVLKIEEIQKIIFDLKKKIKASCVIVAYRTDLIIVSTEVNSVIDAEPEKTRSITSQTVKLLNKKEGRNYFFKETIGREVIARDDPSNIIIKGINPEVILIFQVAKEQAYKEEIVQEAANRIKEILK